MKTIPGTITSIIAGGLGGLVVSWLTSSDLAGLTIFLVIVVMDMADTFWTKLCTIQNTLDIIKNQMKSKDE